MNTPLKVNTVLRELDALTYSQCDVISIEKQLTDMINKTSPEEFTLGLSYFIHVTRNLLQVKRKQQEG